MKSMIGMLLTAVTFAASAQVNDCRKAEEAIAEMSVNIADAFQSGDFEKAKKLIEKADEMSKKGAAESKECGCDKVKEPLGRADALLKNALQLGGGFNEVQDRLYEVIGQSERARRAAELCWRAKVTPPPSK